MSHNRIWTGLDLTVDIYRCSSEGARLNAAGGAWVEADGSLVNYCYFTKASIAAVLPIQRRAVTGRRTKRVAASQYEYEMSVDYFYLSKIAYANAVDVFNRDLYLEIVMSYVNISDPSDSEPHSMLIAKGDFNIATDENGVATGSAKFLGERFS